MLRVRTVFTGVAGSPWYSNLYFNGEDQAVADDAVDAVHAFWDSVRGYISTGITIQVESDVPVIHPEDGLTYDLLTTTTAPIAGSNAADALPRATQGLLRLSTAGVVAGRRVLGRVFLPGFGEGTSSATGQPNPSDRALIENAFRTNVVNMIGADLVIWSRPVFPSTDPDAPAPRDGSTHPVSAVTMWAQWAVLRSRRD